MYEHMYASYLNTLDIRSRENSCIETLMFVHCGAAVYGSWWSRRGFPNSKVDTVETTYKTLSWIL